MHKRNPGDGGETDHHGVNVRGLDEHGMWIGTPRAYVYLDDPDDESIERPTYTRRWRLNAYLGALCVDACIVAERQSTVERWALDMGFRDITIERGDRIRRRVEGTATYYFQEDYE